MRKGEPKTRISLGFPCISDAQCMRNDENSRCVNGICDCQLNNKTSDQCSAKYRGCLQNTFQVSRFGINNNIDTTSTTNNNTIDIHINNIQYTYYYYYETDV